MDKEMNIDKAIEYTKNFIKYFNKNKDDGNKANLIVLGEEIQAIETVLAELEKYKKYYATEVNLFNKYISKDKIKKKIEVLKMEEHYDYIDNKKEIQVLQELLKGSE